MQTLGPETAKVMLVGDFPEAIDLKRGLPLTGSEGQILDGMLHAAGLMRSSCFSTVIVGAQAPYKDPYSWVEHKKTPSETYFQRWKGLWAHPEILRGVERLRKHINLVKPTLVVAMGDLALYELTGEWSVRKWRGSILQGELDGHKFKVLPTLAPRTVMRDWTQRAVTIQDLRRVNEEVAKGPIKTVPDKQYIIRPNFETAVRELSRYTGMCQRGETRLSVDIETRAGHIACVGIAPSRNEAICIPLMCVENREGYWDPLQERVIWHLLRQLLTHPNARVFGQNFLYDTQYFYRFLMVNIPIWFDTMIAQHCMFPGMPKSLDYLASVYCQDYTYWKDDGKLWDHKVSEDRLWIYNCDDCCYTFEIMESQWAAIQADARLRDVWDFQQNKLVPLLAKAMFRGVRVDTAKKSALSIELQQEIKQREDWVTKAIGRPINIKSPKQMQEFLYEELDLGVVKNRKTGRPTTNDEALDKIFNKEPALRPLVRRFRELRSLGVFNSTFVEARLDRDQRMRSSYNPGGTGTFRLSSSENAFQSGINFQNVPPGNEDANDPNVLILPNIRKLYIPDPGCTMFDMDLDRADLQVVVWEADDEELRQALREGVDLHSLNAKNLFGLSCPLGEIKLKHNDKRQLAKSWVHGTNYGGGPRTMAITCGLTIHEAERLQRRWFEIHPGIKKWHDRTEQQLKQFRYVENRFGYRYTFFDRIEGLLPEALAWVPQSTVAVVINKAWDRIDKELSADGVEILIQVHDSLVGQFPTEKAEDMLTRIPKTAEIVVPYEKPLVIPAGINISSVSWGDCK